MGPSGVGTGSHWEPFGLVFETTLCHTYVCSGEGIDFDDLLPGYFLQALMMTGSGQDRDLGSSGRGLDARCCPQAFVFAPC